MEYEGEALLGHWLPRALADIAVMLKRLGGEDVTRKGFLNDWGLRHAAKVERANEEANLQSGLDFIAGWI